MPQTLVKHTQTKFLTSGTALHSPPSPPPHPPLVLPGVPSKLVVYSPPLWLAAAWPSLRLATTGWISVLSGVHLPLLLPRVLVPQTPTLPPPALAVPPRGRRITTAPQSPHGRSCCNRRHNRWFHSHCDICQTSVSKSTQANLTHYSTVVKHGSVIDDNPRLKDRLSAVHSVEP